MIPVYKANDFDNQPLQCKNCDWKGRGSDTNIIDFYGVTDYNEAHCPQCDTPLAQVKNKDNDIGESPDELGFQIG